jgi:surfeit locus 1 family protein
MRVVGVVRGSETPSSFVPDNATSSGEWFWLDVPALAAAAHVPPGTPLVEALAVDGGGSGEVYPMVRGLTPSAVTIVAAHVTRRALAQAQDEALLRRFPVMPDDHRNYAATWLTLSAATGAMAVSALRGRGAAAARHARRATPGEAS